MANEKETLIKLLGLEANATDDMILNSSTTFQSELLAFKSRMEQENEVYSNRATEAVEKLKKAEELLTLANTENKALTEEIVNSDITALGDLINNDNKDTIKEQLISNRASTLKMLKGIKKTEKKHDEPLHNSKTVNQPGVINQSTETPEVELAQARKISNRAREIQKTTGMGYQSAFIAARGELVVNN